MKDTGDWIHSYGEYEAYALILCDFDPYRANLVIENCSLEEIAKALALKKLYNKADNGRS